MKKFLTTMLCIPLCFSAVAFSACNNEPVEYYLFDYFYVDHPTDIRQDYGLASYVSTTSYAESWHQPIRPKTNVRIKSISGKVWYNPEWYSDFSTAPTEDWTTDTFVNNFTVQCDVAGCWDFVMTPESNPEWFDAIGDGDDDISTTNEHIRIELSTTNSFTFGLTHLVIDFEPVENN